MNFASLSRFAAAAGMASAAASASAQYPATVTLPLGDTYTGSAYGASQYGDVSGATVYDRHGGAYATSYGYGAAPPRNTIDRIPVQYLRYYPGVWYGLPGSTLPVVAPQVHMPTDTTQLGFYYQRVPTWVPVPGMVPPSPFAAAAAAAAAGGVTTEGVSMNANERVISVRPLSSGSSAPTHSANGSTATPPGEIPMPPAPSGSRLPLQPPGAPAAEPDAFIPPSELEDLPTIEPLFPVSVEE
jgi:hypothetical protein